MYTLDCKITKEYLNSHRKMLAFAGSSFTRRCRIFGERALPLFVSFNALSACWKALSIRRREVLKVLGGASLAPISRTESTKPAEFQRVYFAS